MTNNHEQKTYFVIAEKICALKIGVSVNPNKRLTSIQCGNPVPLRLVLIENGNHETELHERFKKYRLSGEWFKLTDEICNYIKKRGGKLGRRKRTNPYEGFDYTESFTEKYCDEIYKDVEHAVLELMENNGIDWGCYITEAFDKAIKANNKSRDERIKNMGDGCLYDCIRSETCDAEKQWWISGIDCLGECQELISQIGISWERSQIWVDCKPLITKKRFEQLRLLYQAATCLDCCEWMICGIDPAIPAQKKPQSFFISQFYQKIF